MSADDVRPADARPARQTTFIYWWAYPSRLALLVHLPILLMCAAMDESAYALYRHPVKFLSGQAVVLGVLALVGFALCAAVFEPRRARLQATLLPARAVDTALNVLFVLVLSAYAIFLSPVLVKPQLLLELLQGSTTAMYGLRETLNRIPGVTTLMTLQALVAVLVVTYTRFTGERTPRIYVRLMAVVAVACVMRAWLWSERLAMIELALTVIIAVYAKASPQERRRKLRPLTFAPVAGFVALFVVFAVGEYFRSWQHYQHTFSGSFLEFIGIRFAGYYATALNTGAALSTLHEPLYLPMQTAEWFYKFPLWQFVPEHVRPQEFNLTDFLDVYLNREFNNTSGLFMPMFDFGPYTGVLCWVVLGGFSGYLFGSFARGEVGGLLFFPVWFTGIVEILRVFYWGDSRFFAVIGGGVILILYLTRWSSGEARAPQGAAAEPPFA